MGDGELLATFDAVDAESPRAARAAVRGFARRHVSDEEILTGVALCVSEAVSNVVMHAYRGANPGPAIVTGWTADNALWIVVSDRGLGLIPRLESPGLGMGLPLIAQTSSEVDIQSRAGGGTEVRMKFEIA